MTTNDDIDAIAEKIAKEAYYKAPEQIDVHIRMARRVRDLNATVAKLETQADELYYSLRMADDVGVDENLFEADERCTGPDGLYLELEKRWQEKTPEYQVGGGGS